MLLGVVVVFLLCNVLALIANLLEVEAADKLNIKTFSQHFFGTLIHQLTQTNNLLVTVNRCQEESVCLTIHSVLPTRPFIFFPCQLGELHNLLHLWRKVPPSAAAACGQLSRIPQQNTFHPPARAAQFRGFPPKTKRRGVVRYVCRRWS